MTRRPAASNERWAPTSYLELLGGIRSARWFGRLGDFSAQPGFVALKDLSAWGDVPAGTRETDLALAEQIEWLPTSAAEPDPLGSPIPALGDTIRDEILEIERETHAAVRNVDHPLLKTGPHDFTHAAKGAARYAARTAAKELLAGSPGPWRTIIGLFLAGHWPCGVLPNGDIVVL